MTTYTVTAFNSGGSTTFGVVITVNDVAPSALSYISPNVFTRGTTISNLDPTISGGIVTSYSIPASVLYTSTDATALPRHYTLRNFWCNYCDRLPTPNVLQEERYF
ncbi:MAG: hypothetical protein IPP30_13695 [Flavobacterium sp.]|nr:hypothetical protein [Flavobacterium sp.]